MYKGVQEVLKKCWLSFYKTPVQTGFLFTFVPHVETPVISEEATMSTSN
jgi:hypothetical protein